MPQPPEDGSAPPTSGGLAGQVLDGRYLVEALIGRGGMSEVYRARHLRMDRLCALKVIHPARATDAEANARFEREATAASRITHPNVCQVHDFGVAPDGTRYLAMELLDGKTLGGELAGGPLEPARAARIIGDCAAGLQAAHDAGVVHRDLKPDNVMLVARGGGESAIITDFGIARSGGDPTVTRDGLMVGTPEVMSPEQIAGDPVDARSDQFQLGLLACRLLTGALPFPGATTQETMSRRLTGSPVPLEALRPGLGLPPGVQPVLDRALARRPADRYPTVREFAVAVTGALGGPGAPTEVLARGGSGSDSPVPPTRVEGRPQLPGTRWRRAGLLALAGVLGIAWAVVQGGGEPAAPPPVAPAGDSVVRTASPPSTPTPPPRLPAAAAIRPVLPSADSVFSEFAAVRQRAREQAEVVYRSAAAPDSVRAEAAYLVAASLIPDGLHATVRVWLERCLALQERAGCRSLLSTLP